MVGQRTVTQISEFSNSDGPNELGTQGGRLFVLADIENHLVACWVHWESRNVKRVCRSTATGEVLYTESVY
jgi:hypothetical protein